MVKAFISSIGLTLNNFHSRLPGSRQEAVNGNSASLQTKEREAVVSSLLNSMHTGQIILLTKMLANLDLVFYDFSTGNPVHTWHDRNIE